MSTFGVTVLIPTYNSARYMHGLIADTQWADEILVVDSFSTDETLSLCHASGIRVIQHDYVNSAKQKNWAIPQCTHDWVFLLDTDERVPEALQRELRRLMAEGAPPDVDAYRVARRTYFLDKWLTDMSLWPDYQTRLFRKSEGRYEDKEVHADVRVSGEVRTLENPIDHFATPALSKQIGLLDRYSTYQADELEKSGRKFNWFNLVIRPLGAFFALYVVKRGFRNGVRGLFISFHTMAFVFFSYAKLWEKEWIAGKRD